MPFSSQNEKGFLFVNTFRNGFMFIFPHISDISLSTDK